MIVIFGGTGDLAKKKLMPALYRLYTEGKLKEVLPIVGVGRRELDDEGYHNLLGIPKYAKERSSFGSVVRYYQMDLKSADVSAFADYLQGDKNRIFYLALPPDLFRDAVDILAGCNIMKSAGFQRVIFEKPFGHDLKSATRLNSYISKVFSEEQTYRVDHYLGKELVQTVLVLRFANSIFHEIWNNRFIDNVQITVAEDSGVGKRAAYYDNSGALRDMVQNHMMQVLCLAAMEAPLSIAADDIRDAKVELLRSIEEPKASEIVLGQYGPGNIDGKKARGYRQEEGIDEGSLTETFAAMKIMVENKRWKGVPFYLRTGKRMPERMAQIDVCLKDVSCRLFCRDEMHPSPNQVTIRIQPHDGIGITFNTKRPGGGMDITPVSVDFCHKCEFGAEMPEAYEVLLEDVIRGDQTLFTRWDEVRESWKLVDKIRAKSEKQKKGFPNYKTGTPGPEQAEELLSNDGREWLAKDPGHGH